MYTQIIKYYLLLLFFASVIVSEENENKTNEENNSNYYDDEGGSNEYYSVNLTDEQRSLANESANFFLGFQCGNRSDRESNNFEPIRIGTFLVNNLTNLAAWLPGDGRRGRELIIDIIYEAVRFYEGLLRVVRSTGNLGLEEKSDCNNAGYVYDKHVIEWSQRLNPNCTNGIENVDYILYIFAEDQGFKCHKNEVLAESNQCGASKIDSRPIAGFVILCSRNLITKDWNQPVLQSLLRHEILHALGFNEQGKKRLITNFGNKTETKVIRRWKINDFTYINHTATLLVTANITKFVQKHFNCKELEGAELENEGGVGTVGVHWETRIFYRELMTGAIGRSVRLSGLTLAFLADTGWYKYDTSREEPLAYGADAGCIFAKQSCREYMDHTERLKKPSKPFCNWNNYVDVVKRERLKKPPPRECSTDKKFGVRCNFEKNKTKFDQKSESKQYFLDKRTTVNGEVVTGEFVYGRHELMDGCPVWSEAYYGEPNVPNERRGDSVCSNEYSQPHPTANDGAELYGNNTICLEHDGKFEIYECIDSTGQYEKSIDFPGAGCYKYKCERGRLMIQANYSNDPRKSYTKAYKICWYKGAIISIRRHQISGPNGEQRYHKGHLICPKCSDICENGHSWREANFTCFEDLRINTTDYSPMPCHAAQIRRSLNIYFVLLLCCTCWRQLLRTCLF